MSFLYEHEWLFFIFSEGLTWTSVMLFLISRYKFGFTRFSQIFLLLIILLTLFQGLLVGIDYYYTSKVSLFQVIIILFIIYGSTIGSNDFKRLDHYIQKKINEKRSVRNHDDFYVYIKYRRRLFLIHTIAFIAINIYWFMVDNQLSVESEGINLVLFNETFMYILPTFFNTPFVNIISFLWIIIYIFDLLVFVFYSFWLLRNR